MRDGELRVTFLRLNASWKRTERLAALRAPEFGKPAAASARPANARRLPQTVAACGFALLLGGLLTVYLSPPRYDTYATTIGGRETLKLHDGSKIELNTDTLVRIAQTPHQRLVRLERGEAYFDVHHDEKRPFVVVSDGGRIVDLGTKFSVQSGAGHLKVSLLEGRIRFESKDSSGRVQQTTLSPGDIIVSSAGRITRTRKPSGDMTTDLAWRNGMLVFHETSLADAAAQFNRYNEIKIVISDPHATRETINGTLPTNDLEEFARMARNIFGLRTQRHGNELVLAR